MLVSAYEWEASSLWKLSLSSPPRQRGKSRMEGGQVEPATSHWEDCLLNWTFRLRSGVEVHGTHSPPRPHNQAHGDVCFMGRSGAEWVPSTRPRWLGASLLFPRTTTA